MCECGVGVSGVGVGVYVCVWCVGMYYMRVFCECGGRLGGGLL